MDEVFPAASYQYVLYGMGFPPPEAGRMKAGDSGPAEQAIRQATARARGLAAGLPGNRAYLDALREATMPATLTQDLKG